MAGALSRGLTLADFEVMTIGQVVDFCITYNELHSEGEEEKIAGQEDFNAF